MELKVKLKHRNVKLPVYGSTNSAGIDLIADSFISKYDSNEEERKLDSLNLDCLHLYPNERVLIGTGLYMEIPVGYELQIRSRSGNAFKKGLIVLNQPGTIDSDYRGEIGVIIINKSNNKQTVYVGDKIAQAVLAKHERADFTIVDYLEETERGDGGFGHTGLAGENKPIEQGSVIILNVETANGFVKMSTEEYIGKKLHNLNKRNNGITYSELDVTHALFKRLNGLEPVTALEIEVSSDIINW